MAAPFEPADKGIAPEGFGFALADAQGQDLAVPSGITPETNKAALLVTHCALPSILGQPN